MDISMLPITPRGLLPQDPSGGLRQGLVHLLRLPLVQPWHSWPGFWYKATLRQWLVTGV